MPNTDKKLRRASLNIEASTVDVFGERDDTGKQPIHATVSLRLNELPGEMLLKAAAQGIFDIAGNGFYRRDGITPDEVQAILERTVTAFVDATWSPGRTFTSAETPDIVLALAEVTGVPVHVMEADIAERLVRDENGDPVKDKRGRNKRVFTQPALDALAQDPTVVPVLARLARERADRLALASRVERPTTGALDMFAHLREDAQKAAE